MPDPADDETPGDDTSGLPPELERVLRQLTGGDLDPQVVEMMRSMGLQQVDPQMLATAMSQVQAMLSAPAREHAVDVTVATDMARKVASAADDPAATDADRRSAAEAVHVAGLWLDAVTDLSSPGLAGTAWSRTEWVEATMPVWTSLVEPVADGVTDAVVDAIGRQISQVDEEQVPGLPSGLSSMIDQAGPMIRAMHGSMFSTQLGQGAGTLSGEVLSGCEVGLRLVPAPTVVLMPQAVRDLAAGLSVDEPQVRLYVALREVARVRLFGDIPWLAPALLAAVRDYACGIRIDTDAIEAAVGSIDPADPHAVQEALQGRLFAPHHSATQQAALGRLETLLALVEGWVDVVADQAARAHLPAVDALAESVRRRRATGGPAEKTFGSLVGLELRPRRLRDAANLFRALNDRGGPAARDGAWAHPDIAPSGEDLDDPLGYVERTSTPPSDAVDAELDRLLRGDDPA
ncbi:MAG: zinc-dependent metalloprotease [Dermatophilaceae bacterium]